MTDKTDKTDTDGAAPHTSRLVLLGQIGRAHGIRGEVLVRSFCEPPEAIADFSPLITEDETRSFALTIRGANQKGLICRIDGVADRNAAEALRNTELYVSRDQLPEPDDDEVYHDDLIGCQVRTESGTQLGTIVAIQNFGAGDLIEVAHADNKQTEFYPFEDRFVVELDLEASVMTLDDGVLGD